MMTTTTNAPVAAAIETLPAPRICAHRGCKKALGANNHSGFCHQHHPHTKAKANGTDAAKANGHAVAEKANGFDRHPAGDNGNGAQPLVVDRLKMLCADKDLCRLILDAIPAEDKAVMVAAWLRGF